MLLKNKDQVLPLKNSATVALVGPLADSKFNMLGTWSVSSDHAKSVTVLEGLKNAGANVVYAKGANLSDDTALAKRVNAFNKQVAIDQRSPDAMLQEAVSIAAKAESKIV